jgi:hypothetical protein
MRWSARPLANVWVCAWDHFHSKTNTTSGPGHRATTQLDVRVRQRGSACSRAIRLGPADRHSYTATDLPGGHDCRTTQVLGGSFHQFLFDTHHPDPLLQAMGPTPGTPGPSVVVQETRKMALC